MTAKQVVVAARAAVKPGAETLAQPHWAVTPMGRHLDARYRQQPGGLDPPAGYSLVVGLRAHS